MSDPRDDLAAPIPSPTLVSCDGFHVGEPWTVPDDNGRSHRSPCTRTGSRVGRTMHTRKEADR